MEKTTKMTANEVVQYLHNLERYRMVLEQHEEGFYRIEADKSEEGDYVFYCDILELLHKMTGE